MAVPTTTRRTKNKSTGRCSRWKRWCTGISKRRLAGTLGFFFMTVLTLKRMGEDGIRRPRGRNYKIRPWTPGTLDIHHLQVGSSVSTFVVMPDATTLLIDAGDVNVPYTLSQWAKQGPPLDSLNIKNPYPSDDKTPVGWIIDYMKEFWPSPRSGKLELDYLLLTHFHSDHFGDGSAELTQRSKSASGNYVLSGIPELASKVPIKSIIDRGFPSYNVPVDLRSLQDKSVDNYLAFVRENKDTIHFEQFQVGNSEQIKMLQNSSNQLDFRIRVIKSSQQVAAPLNPNLPKDAPIPILDIPGGEELKDNLHGSENTMSAAIVIEYGPFRYYEGADQEIIRNSDGDVIFDTIGPTAKAAGKVDVATLNHHGHGVSQDYLKYIDPHFMILQGWSSDQPPKRSMEALGLSPLEGVGVGRKIFATDIFQERLDDLGPLLSKLFASKSGHVVVRVHPPERGANLRHRQTFEVLVLDGNRQIKGIYGPFPVRGQ